MGLYNSLMEMVDACDRKYTEPITEKFFFKSDYGKKLAKEINDICKEVSIKHTPNSFKEKLKVNWNNSKMTVVYNETVRKINSKFKAFWQGPIIETMYYVNGVATVTYSGTCWGLTKDYLYKIIFKLAGSGIAAGISEYSVTNYGIPEDIIIFTLKNAPKAKSFFDTEPIGFHKNRISGLDKEFSARLIDYIESNHKDLTAKKTLIGVIIK